MTDIPVNGERIKFPHPIAQQIQAKRAEYKAAGLPYPQRVVDDFYQYPFVWWGRVAYDTRDLVRLEPTSAARARPVVLPDHFILNGIDRLPGESATSYTQYLAYRDLGPQRTFTRLAKALGVKADGGDRFRPRALRHRWEERVRAYDTEMEVEARRVAQKVLEDQMVEQVKRRATYLDNEWSVVEQGFHVLREMLKYPVVEQESSKTTADGKTTITIWKPGRWTYAAMSSLIDTLTKVGRLHTGMSTSNASLKSGDGREQFNHPQDEMSPEEAEMHAYASRKAEEAYFDAVDEWKAQQRNRQQPPQVVTAQIAAGG